MLWFWTPFGCHFGGVLGAQMEARSFKKRFWKVSQNYDQTMISFWSILGSLLGFKMDPERVHKGLLAQVGLPGGPRGSPGADFERIFDHFETYFGMIFWRFLDLYQCSDSLCSKCLLLRFGGYGGIYHCVAATLLNMIWVWSCTLFVILWMQFGTLAGFLMRLLSFQNGILTWLQRRIAVAVLNVLDAPQARPKTTWRAC